MLQVFPSFLKFINLSWENNSVLFYRMQWLQYSCFLTALEKLMAREAFYPNHNYCSGEFPSTQKNMTFHCFCNFALYICIVNTCTTQNVYNDLYEHFTWMHHAGHHKAACFYYYQHTKKLETIVNCGKEIQIVFIHFTFHVMHPTL